MTVICHPFPPLYDANSRILILGSFPSVKSREERFFYGHPQNRFWRVVSAVLEEEVPRTVEEKRKLLLRSHIAVWDVIASCEIVGSADSTIRSVTPNDLSHIFKVADIKCVFTNGKTAQEYYNRYMRDAVGRDAVCLPSTSPANAKWTLPRLIEAWRVIRV